MLHCGLTYAFVVLFVVLRTWRCTPRGGVGVGGGAALGPDNGTGGKKGVAAIGVGVGIGVGGEVGGDVGGGAVATYGVGVGAAVGVDVGTGVEVAVGCGVGVAVGVGVPVGVGDASATTEAVLA